jgi:hypothetical protein
MLLPSAAERDEFISHLREHDILAVSHYQRMVRLPLCAGLPRDEIDLAIEAILWFEP